MQNRKLFLLDNDGTLVSGLGPYEDSLQRAIKREFDEDVEVDMTNFHGLTDRNIAQKILEANGIEHEEDQINRTLLYFGAFYEANKRNTKIIKNVNDHLKALRDRGHLLAIVTGNVMEMARKKLDLYGLNEYLPFGAFGNENTDRSKLVDLALDRAISDYNWVKGKEGVYVVGDTVHDIQAANKAGVRGIGVLTGKGKQEQLESEGAYRIIRNLGELADLD